MLHFKFLPGFWIRVCHVYICEARNGNFESQEMQKYVQYEMYQHCEWIKLFKLTSHISYLTRCIPQIIFHMHFTCLNKVKMERCLPLGTRISQTEYLDNLKTNLVRTNFFIRPICYVCNTFILEKCFENNSDVLMKHMELQN